MPGCAPAALARLRPPLHISGRRPTAQSATYDQTSATWMQTRPAFERVAWITRVIVFLCSDEVSYITGTTLTPDGGLTLSV
jgi:NAD(P)-dependent dehydrogenase (short-subunit alcohol dehydrogenase family)